MKFIKEYSMFSNIEDEPEYMLRNIDDFVKIVDDMIGKGVDIFMQILDEPGEISIDDNIVEYTDRGITSVISYMLSVKWDKYDMIAIINMSVNNNADGRIIDFVEDIERECSNAAQFVTYVSDYVRIILSYDYEYTRFNQNRDPYNI